MTTRPALRGNGDRPPRIAPRLMQAPKLRDLLWCDFPHDVQLPEFWKRRPVAVVAGDRRLSGTVVVVPCPSQNQAGNPWAIELATAIDGEGPSWAVCDKPTTVAVSRLSLDRSGRRPPPPGVMTQVRARGLRRFPPRAAAAG